MPVTPSKPVPTDVSNSQLLDAWKNGTDPGALVGSPTKDELDLDPPPSTPVESADDLAAKLLNQTTSEQSEPDTSSEEVSPSPDDADPSATASTNKKQPQASSVKYVEVKDAQGRKTRVPVDLSDTDAILKSVQKMHALEHGMRKFQAERDALAKGNTEVKQQADHFKALSDAYAKNGLAGIVNYIEGDESAYSKVEKALQDRWEIRRTATPAELEAMEYQERLEAARKEAETEREANKKFREQIAAEREAAEIKQLESVITPAFEKYNFTGKLGSKESEQMVNQMIWNTAMSQLEPYETQGVELTSDLIDKTFRDVANTFRTVVKSQAETKAKASIEAKKQAATESAQSRVMSGVANTADQQQVAKMLQENDVRGLVRKFFK